MTDMQCPYCNADQTVCHDDGAGYDEGRKHEHTCRACDKTFVFETTISFHYSASKADCLNDAPHELALTKTWPKKYSRMACKHCDFERTATEAEIEAAP